MEKIRSFIAINLPEEIKTELSRLQAHLQSGKQSSIKWVDPFSIHLTLKFLGNITTEKIAEITGAIEKAAEGIPAFYLQLRDPGAFPDLKRVQVVWVGLSGDIDKLSQLQKRIESNLTPLGFTPESRAFTPHLTLARVRDQASPDERQALGQLIASNRLEATSTIKVNSVNLMKSQLTRTGAIYSQISSVELRESHIQSDM